MWLALVIGCGGSQADDNIAACEAFEAGCDGIETARDGLYANCTVWGGKDAEENCDYVPFLECVADNAVCDPEVVSDGSNAAPWLVDAFTACDGELPETCEGALYVRGAFVAE